MTDLRIGRLLFRKEAVMLIACCFFINGIIIGAFAVLRELSHRDVSFILVYAAMLTPYVLLFKRIKRHVIELEKHSDR